MTCPHCTGSRSLADDPALGPCVCAPWSRVEHLAPGVTLYCGDSAEVLPALDTPVHAIVTDPPYGLGAHPDPEAMLRAWLAGEAYAPRGSAGFMGKAWDAFVPGPELWREAVRLLPPGGHLIAAFGTRTYDLGALAVRFAGLEGDRSPHPTVKPTDLMRWFCRMVTPAGGVVLDPFMGSGSTGRAAVLEGYRRAQGACGPGGARLD